MSPTTVSDMAEPDFVLHHRMCKPFTMTSDERLYALYLATRFVVTAGLAGDFVECGVWQGGSVMMMALVLQSLGVTDRDIYLFDTFEGMTPPSDHDVDAAGIAARDLLARGDRTTNEMWAYAPIDAVRANLRRTGYPMDRFKLVPGDVLETLPRHAPDTIALLRLDTDWYESTKHELEQLFPRLAPRGALIIDDYGHFQGARRAIDEYLETLPTPYLMHRIDYTARLILKA